MLLRWWAGDPVAFKESVKCSVQSLGGWRNALRQAPGDIFLSTLKAIAASASHFGSTGTVSVEALATTPDGCIWRTVCLAGMPFSIIPASVSAAARPISRVFGSMLESIGELVAAGAKINFDAFPSYLAGIEKQLKVIVDFGAKMQGICRRAKKDIKRQGSRFWLKLDEWNAMRSAV